MSEGAMMTGSYEPGLVALSVFISLLGSYATLELDDRMAMPRGRVAWWLIGGAVASAFTTWAMHYIGMAAFKLPVPVLYHWPTVLLSFLPAAVSAALALIVVGRRTAGWSGALLGSVLLGAGISGLHYSAMAGMRFRGMCHYSMPLVALSIAVPMIVGVVPLKMTFLTRDRNGYPRLLRKAASVVVLGAANPAMHFTAMAATSFTQSSEAPDLSRVVDISAIGASAFSIVAVMAVAVVLITTLVDRFEEQRILLDELFEQSREAVALLGSDGRVVRVNREFSRLFDITPQEALGRPLRELIAAGLETFIRKDGTVVHVSMIQVPVRGPGGQVATYAIYRDITAQQQAQQMVQAFSKKLIEAQEAERKRVARELHDEIGQALTAIRLNLEAAKDSDASGLAKRLAETLEISDRAMEQVRDLSLDLRPPMLDDLGLVAALRSHVGREAERAGLSAELVAGELERLSPELETACFRIAQEALTNVVRHAQARHVRVELAQRGAELHLIVRDDGIGFDTRARNGAGLGILGMKERAVIVGGSVEIRSAPGQGTEVHARLPLVRAPAGT